MSKIGKFKQILLIRPRQVPLLAQRFYQKRKFNYDFYTNKLKIFYSRVLKDVFIVKKCTGRCILRRLERCFSAFWPRFWKFKKPRFSVAWKDWVWQQWACLGMASHFPLEVSFQLFLVQWCAHICLYFWHMRRRDCNLALKHTIYLFVDLTIDKMLQCFCNLKANRSIK
jgi:hypothetical protein